jgi:hypothetical protein
MYMYISHQAIEGEDEPLDIRALLIGDFYWFIFRFVCMWVQRNLYLYIYIYVYICTFIYIYLYTHTYIYVYICISHQTVEGEDEPPDIRALLIGIFYWFNLYICE